MNYFAYPTAAERYNQGRPVFHPLAVEKIRAICCPHGRVGRALDVGCGTGRSTVALSEIAAEVVGLDSSREMLALVKTRERIHYTEARAERMPFADAAFGLVNVACAFHWFTRREFLLEARRVLRPGGWLVIYNHGIVGKMNGNDAYERWNKVQYLGRYPIPPRNDQPFTASDAVACGFVSSRDEKFTHELEFTPTQLVSYLLTQSNIIAAVEAGSEDLPAVARWLMDCVRPMFTGATAKFPFSCEMRFLRRK